jgi:uncharacterized protein with GYD domain
VGPAVNAAGLFFYSGGSMPKFLIEANYASEGTKGLIKEGGSGRRAAVEQAVKAVGGKVDALYFGFGSADLIVIVDVPDSVSAIAISLAVNSSGKISMKTTPLITAEEMDAASKKTVGYRAPGA